MDIIKATAAEAGCWVDGHWGHYGMSRVVTLAAERGMPLSDDDRAILAAYDDGGSEVSLTLPSGETVDVGECVFGQGEMADKAEQWLNDHVAPEGCSFGWHDGEFFLQPAAWWEEETP